MTRLDELALITRCALADDRQAFGRLVEAYQPRVRRFLLNLTAGDAALTDDLAQETFIKAYTGLRGFKGLAGFGTWLMRIACNEFYTHTRRQREQLLGDSPAEDALGVDDGEVAALDASLTVREALASLTDDERTAVTLFYLDDRPLREVSCIMRLSENTVKSHLHRARQRMRRIVDANE